MRRRVRLQIGINGLLFLAIIILMLSVAISTQANLLFWVFGLMVGGFMVSLALPLMMLRSVTIKRLLPEHSSVDEPIHLRYLVTNHSRIFAIFGLVVIEDVQLTSTSRKKRRQHNTFLPHLAGQPHGWILHLGPRQTGQAETTGWPVRRGLLQLNKITLRTSFPFGIITYIKTFQQQDQLLVYPRLYSVNRRVLYQLSSTYLHGKQQRMRSGGHEEFFGLREYRAGESIKLVDWKHSAKIGRWISREMTQPAQPKLMLALDMTKVTLSDPSVTDESIEKAISLAASMICDAHTRGYEAGMTILGSDQPAFRIHRSLGHRARMLETLANLEKPQHENHDQESLRSKMSAEPTVIITPADIPSSYSRAGKITLSAADINRFIEASPGGSKQLLTNNLPAIQYSSHAAGGGR